MSKENFMIEVKIEVWRILSLVRRMLLQNLYEGFILRMRNTLLSFILAFRFWGFRYKAFKIVTTNIKSKPLIIVLITFSFLKLFHHYNKSLVYKIP